MKWFVVLTMLLLFGVMGGCGDTIPAACSDDQMCGKNLICLESHCVPGCRTASECSGGELCFQNKCTTQVCTPGAKEACYIGPSSTKGVGLCQSGTRFCLEEGTSWSACVRQVLPQVEVCDKDDNDCDGKVDEGLTCSCTPGSRRACYQGGAGTLGLGGCRAGIQYCGMDFRWGKCVGQQRPNPEICNGFDDNCNGTIDEYIDCQCKPGTTRPCYSGPEETAGKGSCKKGEQVCGPGNKWGLCKGEVLPTLEEDTPCNGKDDDCDGQTDERADGQGTLSERCYFAPEYLVPNSRCKRGVRICQDGQWGKCEGEVRPLPKELCGNALDDNCDGKVDEGCTPTNCTDGDTRPCYPEKTAGCSPDGSGYNCVSPCKAGIQLCQDAVWGNCLDARVPTEEICGSQQDENCDGKLAPACQKDERCVQGKCVPNATEPVSEPMREMVSTERILDAGTETLPEAKPEAKPETKPEAKPEPSGCAPGSKRLCYVGTAVTRGVGECKDGEQLCLPTRSWGACVGSAFPTTEVCDGKDNDCDGSVDEGSFGGIPCPVSSNKGECAKGKLSCVNGGLLCVAVHQSVAETCDGKDNDCDGLVDESLTQACSSPCGSGKETCIQGMWLACDAPLPRPETCDGKDNDCNGSIDDGNLGGVVCNVPNTQGECAKGTLSCVNGTLSCVSSTNSVQETCDGKDNDCDGLIDELSDLKNTAPKCANQKGVCAGALRPCKGTQGWQACTVSDYFTHSNDYRTVEKCDGKDNDCNGQVDDLQGGCSWFFTTSSFSGASGGASPGIAVARDSSDNLYIVGQFDNSLHFGSTMYTTNFSPSMYVVKISPSGAYLWSAVAHQDATNEIVPKSITVTPDGSVFVAGSFKNKATFGSHTINASAGVNDQDGFLVRLSNQGQFTWAGNFGGLKEDELLFVRAFNNSTLYVSGISSNNFLLGGKNVSVPAAKQAFFYARLDISNLSSITATWVKTAGDAGAPFPGMRSLFALDASGNLYATGTLNSAGSLPYVGANQHTNMVASGVVFVAKMAATNGKVDWVLWSNESDAGVRGITLTPTSGEIIIGGGTLGGLQLGSTTLGTTTMIGQHMFLARVQESGGTASFTDAVWFAPTPPSITPVFSTLTGLASDSKGDILAIGTYDGTLTLGGPLTPSVANYTNVFVSRFKVSNSKLVVSSAIGAGGSGSDQATGIVLDKKDNLYIVGDYKESPTFAQHKPAAGPNALTITFGRLFVWQLLYPKP